MGLGLGLLLLRSLSSPFFCVFDAERERRRLSWRRRPGSGDPEELDELEELDLEDPERLVPEELEPLEEPELEPELLLELLLLPVDALRRLWPFSLPLSLSPPSLVAVFSFPRSFDFSSSLRFVGDGAISFESEAVSTTRSSVLNLTRNDDVVA